MTLNPKPSAPVRNPLDHPVSTSKILTYHMTRGEVDNATLQSTPQEFDTLLPKRTLRNSRQGGVIDATGKVATLLAADLLALNGLVHAIDQVRNLLFKGAGWRRTERGSGCMSSALVTLL